MYHWQILIETKLSYSIFSEMASHNSKYYNKKRRKRDGDGNYKITDIFRKSSQTVAVSDVNNNNNNSDTICSTSNDYEEPHISTESLSASSNLDLETDKPAAKVAQYTETTSISTSSDTYETQNDNSTSETTQIEDEQEVRLFELSKKYSINYPWLYYNFSKGGYLCKNM